MAPLHVATLTVQRELPKYNKNDWVVYIIIMVHISVLSLSTVVNACNASLRNKKFSNMAVRTRKQYLNDLAEQSSTAITLDQANTSGRVGKSGWWEYRERRRRGWRPRDRC